MAKKQGEGELAACWERKWLNVECLVVVRSKPGCPLGRLGTRRRVASRSGRKKDVRAQGWHQWFWPWEGNEASILRTYGEWDFRMSILARVGKKKKCLEINICVSKLSPPAPTCTFLLPFTKDKRQPYKLRRETKRFLDSSCSGEITNEGRRYLCFFSVWKIPCLTWAPCHHWENRENPVCSQNSATGRWGHREHCFSLWQRWPKTSKWKSNKQTMSWKKQK